MRERGRGKGKEERTEARINGISSLKSTLWEVKVQHKKKRETGMAGRGGRANGDHVTGIPKLVEGE